MSDAKQPLSFKAGETRAPVTLTALRVGVGVIMVVHGWTKLMDVSAWQAQLGQLDVPAPEVAGWLAIAGELLGGAGLVLGLLTPLAAFGVLATMLTAIFTVHAGHGLLAKDGGFEYPLTLALVATYFMVRGAGPISLDALVQRRRRRAESRPSSRSSRSQPAAAAV